MRTWAARRCAAGSWSLVALCGCNAIFGLTSVTERDAAFFDAPIDAAPTCPTGQPVVFSPVLHQVALQLCASYSEVAGRAACACFLEGQAGICEGPAGTTLSWIDLGLAGFVGQADSPRLTPDAAELFVRVTDYNTSLQTMRSYARQPDGSWQRGPDAPFGTGTNDAMGTFANGPTGIRTIVNIHADGSLHEWVREAGQWSDLGSPGQSPLNTAGAVNLTIDGLHAMQSGPSGGVYLERPSLDAGFAPAQPMPGVPPSSVDATLTSDCGRVYLTGLGGVFYVQR